MFLKPGRWGWYSASRPARTLRRRPCGGLNGLRVNLGLDPLRPGLWATPSSATPLETCTFDAALQNDFSYRVHTHTHIDRYQPLLSMLSRISTTLLPITNDRGTT
ncbi:hypothetical protein LZ30DRAFT_60809 [Colletotrichum cereale]|nr:hypothetical protein LZ30DRAFT_60809 [Colletotrichum cereale]